MSPVEVAESHSKCPLAGGFAYSGVCFCAALCLSRPLLPSPSRVLKSVLWVCISTVDGRRFLTVNAQGCHPSSTGRVLVSGSPSCTQLPGPGWAQLMAVVTCSRRSWDDKVKAIGPHLQLFLWMGPSISSAVTDPPTPLPQARELRGEEGLASESVF